jgi:putative spermidine/putrescine transport system substrate-binding protein
MVELRSTSSLGFYRVVGLVFWACLRLSGCRSAPPDGVGLDLSTASWEEIEQAARGQAVNMTMWMGDPLINEYMRGFVAPSLQEQYGVTLRVSAGQGNQIVSMVMTEIEAGKAVSEVDLVWINGETFYQLRQIDALFGPFTDRLPNAAFVDLENPFIGVDFQQPVDGYEAPWGNVQFALITDTLRVPDPPRTRAALADWVHAHPGRFTFDNGFAGMTLLKALLIDIAGGPEALAGPFDEARYRTHSAALWEYINGIKPYFWMEGATYPAGVAQLHQMFANGEVDFTMSNNDGEVDNKVRQGLFPASARAFVLEGGTIQNSHYLGIVRTAPNRAGAMVAINFLLSPEAQLRKADPEVWGDGTVLAIDRLPAEWQPRFREAGRRAHAPPREALQPYALPELAPEYMIRLYDDFRTHVLAP